MGAIIACEARPGDATINGAHTQPPSPMGLDGIHGDVMAGPHYRRPCPALEFGSASVSRAPMRGQSEINGEES